MQEEQKKESEIEQVNFVGYEELVYIEMTVLSNNSLKIVD